MQLRLEKRKRLRKREKESKENLEKIKEQDRKSRFPVFAQNNNNGSASVGIKFSF